ncbi:Zinc finger protein 226 [Frankliniella fusca]|uniref:Zinc finger protein 226 n=1 Tax=Frankliniella fusca TaxID=407009 RepID=A0AAE1H0F0_9NEOP|nr:Zinc finger protein 226 [Frankliniella fusca]
MPTCSVPYCLNTSGKDCPVSFHEFPHETPLFLNKWIENIGRPNWRPGLRSVVCSDHFEKGDFDRKGRLHIGSFPSKFPEPPTRKKKKSEEDGGTDREPLPNTPTQLGKLNLTPVVQIAPLKQTLNSSLSGVPIVVKTPQNKKLIISNVSSNIREQTSTPIIPAAKSESSNIRIIDLSKESAVSTANASESSPPVDVKANPTKNVARKNGNGESSKSNATVSNVMPSSKSAKDPNIFKKIKITETDKAPGLVASVLTSYSLLSCRICGLTNKANIDIFGEQGKTLGLAEMIRKCLSIVVMESDTYPTHVCISCVSRLKDFSKMITVCSRTNEALRGNSDSKGSLNNSITISRVSDSQASGDGNRRVLLLELPLVEGIRVKDMVIQAVQELNIRLQPKESRETKPQGRIMFLDLQGGTEAFPEQMKKAISMLFPNDAGAKSAVKRKVVNFDGQSAVSEEQKKKIPKTTTKQTPFIISSSVTSNNAVFVTTVPGRSQAAVTNTVPSTLPMQKGVGINARSSIQVSTPTSLPPLLMKPFTSIAPSPGPLIAQAQPVLTAVPATCVSSSAIRITLPAGSLPSSSVPHLIRLPSNFIKVNQKSAQCTSSTATPSSVPSAALPTSVAIRANVPSSVSSDDDDVHFWDDHCYTEENPQPNKQDIPMPSLVPIKEGSKVPIKESPKVPIKEVSKVAIKESTISKQTMLPQLDIAQLKDKVITKINNMGNQFKLGDKIVGIVLRNSDSREDIHKKLQATFSKGTPLKESGKAIAKTKERVILPKERAILPKGSSVIALPGDTIISSESLDGAQKSKDRPLDVHASVDSPSTYFDRRNARKLSLSFMWRKCGYLVSSYQKLFTWRLADSPDTEHVLSCRVCKFAAKSRADAESHLQEHPDLQCTVCWKYFLTPDKVLEHMNVIHTSSTSEILRKKSCGTSWRVNTIRRTVLKQYQCSRCERRFKAKENLKRHIAVCKERTLAEKVQAISSGSLLSCQVCHRNFNSPGELQDHVIVHTKRTSWLCDICGMVLKSASNYRSHIARHDENAADYEYQCGTCKKRFKLKHRYETHLKKHDNRQTFVCSSCGKTFNTLNGLRQHEVLHGERKLQCKFCPSRFHRRDHLRIHEASHTKGKSGDGTKDHSRRSFTCRFCVAKSNVVVKFPNMRELMRHYNDEHADERLSGPQGKRFECDRCTRSFANSTLLRHHHMWHAGIRPYTCSTCGAGFMIKERLRNHEMTHTNERPFKCQVCGKGFRSRNCLKQHKAIHMDPNDMFKCSYCDKTFSRVDNLRTHTRVHTGEKPWKCLNCQKQFRLRSECSKHIQVAHKIPAEEVFQYVETLPETQDAIDAESNSSTSVIDAALAGITTVQDMEILIEADDMVEDEDSL